MGTINRRILVELGPALIVGAIAVAVASSVYAIGMRVVLQAAAVICVAAIGWRTGASDDALQTVSSASGTSAPALQGLVADRRKPVFDRDTGLCVNWYFRLRVEEEMARATRYGQPFTIMTVSADSHDTLEMCRLTLKKWLRTVDYAGDMGDSIAVMLPATDRAGATLVVERLTKVAPGVNFKLSQFPVDGATVAHLLGEEEWHVSDAAALSA